VNALTRGRRLEAKLLSLRHGPGAAVLPPEVTRIHLSFAKKWQKGHLGPRIFWKENMPRLKYWNPAVPMIVNRGDNQAGPAELTVYIRDEQGVSGNGDTTSRQGSSATEKKATGFVATSSTKDLAKAPIAESDERLLLIDMKHQKSEAILQELLRKTGAQTVFPTEQEKQQMDEVRARAVQADKMRKHVGAMVSAQKRAKQAMTDNMAQAAEIKAGN